MTGKTLAHYHLEDRLGEGGSGVVYRGRDLRLERAVAIKVLADALRDDELAWGRLLREARLASQLNHPHIASIYDLGEEEGYAYIVMELVEGLMLADLIPEGGIPPAQVERYTLQIAGALAFAHQQGVIHGDLKGSNIIVTPEGNLKLLDFGLGRRIPRNGMEEVTNSNLPLTDAGATAGTLPYLAPEVLRGGAPSVQSDAWALGVLVYQMATGELPFRGATPFELSVEIMVGTPTKLAQLAEPLQSVVRRCLERDLAARLPDVREAANAFGRTASNAGAPAEAPAAVRVETPAESPRANHPLKWWAAGGAAAMILFILCVVYARHVWTAGHTLPQRASTAAPKPSNQPNPAVKVWVNTDTGVYHCPGTRWFGKTQVGEYMLQKEAQAKGYHAAGGRLCM